jgi:hypothetical protein
MIATDGERLPQRLMRQMKLLTKAKLNKSALLDQGQKSERARCNSRC